MYHPFALAVEMAKLQGRQGIPTKLSLAQFEQFVLPHLISGSRGPEPKLGAHAIFNYILRLLYTGCQWKELAIEKDTCVFHAIMTVDFRGVTGHFKNIVTDDFRNSVTGFG